uniref:Dual serine/threonine and tyrosine protein kinase-like n=1 Tax=Saccoglossus kowalevskii TaxID=10224 RepID=A0ABM0MQE7_SACKO|nr:PREDICTED: dual serine/threonine and tyrosine protein kinase-like [Saccoglossus kowalevskii]
MMLGGTYVAAKQTPSTARLVKLTYGKTQRVRIVNRDGSVLEEKTLRKKTVPRKWIELDEKARRDPKMLGSYIVAEVDNEFLSSGIEVVDSPGLKENEELDKMVLNELKTIVPFVVYVLDGKNQLTNQDREDIKKVQAITKNIFYVVTKVDKDDESDDDDDDEAAVVLEKKTRAYNSLVKEGYLPTGVKMEDCERFHGISNWRVKEYRKQGRRDSDPFVKDYYRFQQCLCSFVRSSLDSIVLAGSKLLLSSLTACLDFFIRRATASKEQQRQIKQKIEECRQQEGKIYSNMASKIKNKTSQISKDISAGVRASTDGIIRDSSSYHFTDIAVPRDEVVSNRELLKQCQTQMEEFVMTKLCTEISEKLSKTFKDEDSILSDLIKVVQELEKEQPDKDVSEILRLCTMSSYVDGLRPENRGFNKQCWALMQRCWHEDATKRPDFDTIVKDLVGIRKRLA